MSENFSEHDSAIRHGEAQVNGIRLHYAECGSGDRLVLLLHGFPECWYSWRHQLTALGERYHVVAPDMRGYNLSDKPPRVEDYLLDALVGDVIGLIKHFGAREASVVGHDWGASAAWAVAQSHPEYVSKLAAMQVPPPAAWSRNITPQQMLRSWYMFYFQLPRLPEWQFSRNDFAALEQLFKTTARRGTFTDADIAVYKSSLREPGALTAAFNYYRANVKKLLIKRLTGAKDPTVNAPITVPTLFIFGERDFAILPETVRGIGDFIDAPYREVRLAASGHWVQQESPAEVSAALMSFLED